MLERLFRARREPAGPVEYLVVGLGNPGEKYEGTRHNAGFMALDFIAGQAGAKLDRLKFKGLCADAAIGGKRVLLLKPGTYMNLSGQSVVEAMNFYKLPPERVIVLYDDISFPPGKLRVRLHGSDAFPRVRLGTGDRPDPRWDLADWVLSKFSPDELKLFREALGHAADAVELIVQGKADEAMNKYNG